MITCSNRSHNRSWGRNQYRKNILHLRSLRRNCNSIPRNSIFQLSSFLFFNSFDVIVDTKVPPPAALRVTQLLKGFTSFLDL
jgi:hypothetical protein